MYKSRTVHAIIAPNLCTPLLLGGPFLAHNKIVIDHELRTVIAKDDNYDLLNPPAAKPTRPTSIVPNQLQVYGFKQDVVSELKQILPKYKAIIDNECEPVKGIDVVAAVRGHIDRLAIHEQLIAKDTAIKTEFIDCFPSDIPHNDTMPTDVLFRIRLKDANKVIQKRSYDCPKKYKAAWKTLLDLHLESG